MICRQCRHNNKKDASVCAHCGADLAAPKSIEINFMDIPVDGTDDEKPAAQKVLIAAIVAGAVVVAAIVILVVMLSPAKDVAADEPHATPSTQAPAHTPIETPSPSLTDDFDSLFDAPAEDAPIVQE